MNPNPDQPDRCPSIDPYDTLQCARRIHDDDQCQAGGIAWRKGAPRTLMDSERLALARDYLSDLTNWSVIDGRRRILLDIIDGKIAEVPS